VEPAAEQLEGVLRGLGFAQAIAGVVAAHVGQATGHGRCLRRKMPSSLPAPASAGLICRKPDHLSLAATTRAAGLALEASAPSSAGLLATASASAAGLLY